MKSTKHLKKVSISSISQNYVLKAKAQANIKGGIGIIDDIAG